MVDITHWGLASTTAALNLAVQGNTMAEGWLPSGVNNNVRSGWAIFAGMVADLGGTGTVGGTANAITLTCTIPEPAFRNGSLVALKNSSGPNTAAATLNRDGLGAKAIRMQGDVALIGGEMLDDGIYIFRYDTAYNGAAGAWVLLNPSPVVGTYTPTLTNTTNLDASTAILCHYERMLDKVIVFWSANVDPTATAATTLKMTLPIASNLAGTSLWGSGASTGGEAVSVVADAANDLAQVQFVANSTANHGIQGMFGYTII